MRLRDVDISPGYSTDSGKSILDEFYNPVLETAVRYDRITGFFSPRVFAIAARGFRKCAANGCKIRIITSVYVEDETFEAITEATKLSEISQCLEDFSADALHDDLNYNYLQLFMQLYARGQLELKIAAIRSGNGMFHEKIGIVTDKSGDTISFSGSNNETASGWINNVEEFKVFKDWEPVQSDYCALDKNKFEEYWNDSSKRFKVLTLDEAESQKLVKRTLEPDLTIEEISKRIYQEENKSFFEDEKKPKLRQIRPYQKEAIQHWADNNYVSVFEMATGTGKTFTAINALKRFREDKGALHCVIGVPLISLLKQWEDEVRQNFEDVKVIVASPAIEKDWKKKLDDLVVNLMMGIRSDFVILVPYVTFAGEEFLGKIKRLVVDDVVFLADEMHNLVTERVMGVLSSERFPYRLGLSATPVRLWAQEESAAVMRFFGDNPYVFSLERAIKEEFLVPFNYYVYPVNLTLEEFEDYCNISKEIGRYGAMGDSHKDSMVNAMLKRARIKKNAENKLLVMSGIVDENKKRGMMDRSLFYVDNTEMLEEVQRILAQKGLITSKFTGVETIETRLEITDALRRRDINAIVAIKCLDEGVDIPSARNAFFISSNTDSREYVQRLGRVLRRDDESGKTQANIFDFVVIPPGGYSFQDVRERETARNLVRNEVIRTKFFYELAKNGEEAKTEVEDIVGDIGMTFTEDELNINNEEKYGKTE